MKVAEFIRLWNLSYWKRVKYNQLFEMCYTQALCDLFVSESESWPYYDS
jgi:hypothetical protein